MRAWEFTQDKMKEAIESPPGRDEQIDYKSVYFAKTPIITKIHDLNLKKYINGDELWYGLLNNENGFENLVGILQLEKYKNYWQVRLSQVEDKYKSQGYGSYLYDYAVMNDGLTLISDFPQTTGDLGGSKGLWEKLYRQGRFTVCGYNVDTDEKIILKSSADIPKIYTQKEDIVWMATPKENKETINEMLLRLNTRNKHRTIEWYGPNIKDN